MIISVSGKMQAGKDTTGKIIQFLTQKNNKISLEEMLQYPSTEQPNTTEWKIKKYAGKLKECISLITGVSLLDLEREDIKNSNLGPEWNFFSKGDEYSMTVRKILQLFGTEGGRTVHPNIWVNALFADYKPTLTKESKNNLIGHLSRPKQFQNKEIEYRLPNWVITDCRFVNEANAAKERDGILINVIRDIPRDPAISQHASETALDYYDFDYVLDNNGTIPELAEKVAKILRQHQII